MLNNTAGALNVKVNVEPGPTTDLDADIIMSENVTVNGGGISILGVDAAGYGNINGSIVYSKNTGTAPDAKFGVILYGDVSGDISGPIRFHANDLSWLAVLTTGSSGGAIGSLTMTNNLVESLEFEAIGGPILGPVIMRGNRVLDLGGATGLDNPLILLHGSDGMGRVTIENNIAPDADLVVRASNGLFSGEAVLRNNTAGLLTLDSQASAFSEVFEVVGNFYQPPMIRAFRRSRFGPCREVTAQEVWLRAISLMS